MKNKTEKIAIFGGSFCPPHFGHTDIVKNLERLFDRVIVVPAFVSPFKNGVKDDAALRLKLCKRVFSSEKTVVSNYEIRKKSVSYSVNTAKYFKKKFADAALYWVLGSEELISLLKWHRIDELKTLVTFYAVRRPNLEPSADIVKALKKRGIKIKFAPFVGADISSSRIKIDLAFGMENRYMPDAVYKYAVNRDVFNPYAVYVNGLREHGLTYNRLAHTYRTACRGAELAKLYGADVDDVITACILHDIAKSEDAAKYAGFVDTSAYPEPTVHAPVGAYIAKREFGVSDEIARAIELHSTADANMTVLDEAVYLADKTEDGRRYPSLEHKRYLCGVDKNIAMLAALTEIRDLNETDKCVASDRAIEYYTELCGGAEIPTLPKKPSVTSAKNRSGSEIRQKRAAAYKPTGDAVKDMAFAVAAELDLHKARDIDIIDLNGKTIVADYFVIASATSTTAVKALMGYVEDMLTKKFGVDPNKRDINSEWIALDYGGIIIHIFTEKTRAFYNIERLWADGKNIVRYGV